MAKENEVSFELDVDEISKSESKIDQPLRKEPPKKRVHHVAKVVKEEHKKESQKKDPNPEPPSVAAQADPGAHRPSPGSTKALSIKLPSSHHESIVIQPKKEEGNLLGIHVDPVVAAAVGTAAAVAAGTAAVTTGVATPAITAVKAGIIKAKAALGFSSKAAVIAGGAAVAGAALVVLEKKFNDYEKDLLSTKKEVGDISDQIKKLDELIDKVKSN